MTVSFSGNNDPNSIINIVNRQNLPTPCKSHAWNQKDISKHLYIDQGQTATQEESSMSSNELQTSKVINIIDQTYLVTSTEVGCAPHIKRQNTSFSGIASIQETLNHGHLMAGIFV